MDVRVRRVRIVKNQDQENQHPLKGKANVLPGKRQGLAVRGALGEINDNIQRLPDVVPTKGANSCIEDKKAAAKSAGSDYSHVQPKIDSGLNNLRTVLRREESTAGHASRAAKVTTTLKKINEVTTKKAETKKVVKIEVKVLEEKPIVKERTVVKEKPVVKEKANVKAEAASLDKLRLVSIEEEDQLLPPGVIDIDAKDRDCTELVPNYINDIYNYLRELEDKYVIRKDYLDRQAMITGHMRATLIDWLVEVQTQFNLILETLHLTISILDRYLQVTTNVERNKLQLVGVTAMVLASKYEEIYPPELDDFIFITDHAYTKAELLQCERDMITKLGFCLAKPTPLQFLRRFVKAAHGTKMNHHLGKYFVELCLVDYSMVHYKPSELAAAAICLSIYLKSNKPLNLIWTPTMVYYSKYKLRHIFPIMAKIAKIVIENPKTSAVSKKYMKDEAAPIIELKENLIKQFAAHCKDV